METNTPPNVTDFTKKSPTRNKRRYTKRRTTKDPADFDLSGEDDRKTFTYIIACVFIMCAATMLKDKFNPNAGE